MSLQDSMIRAAALNAFNEANKMARDPLFQQDIKENIAAVGRGARTLPVSLAGGAGDLAYMAVNPFLQLVGQGLRPEESFGTTEYLSNIPAVRELIGQEEDSLPYQAGAVLPLLALANVPDTAEMVGKALPELTNKINSFISDIPKDFAALTPEGSMFRVTETLGPTGKTFDKTPKTATAVIAGKKGDYTQDKFKIVDKTDNLFETDIGEGVVQNAQIGVGEKGPFLNVGDVLEQNLKLDEYKKRKQNLKIGNEENLHNIKINLRKKSSFGNKAYLGGKPPKGLEDKPLISIETKYQKGASEQHFYAVNVNLTGNSYLAKYPKKENPRLKVEQFGQVYIDTSKSNIVGYIKKGNPEKRGNVFKNTANIKKVDGEFYIPIYKEVWTEGSELTL